MITNCTSVWSMSRARCSSAPGVVQPDDGRPDQPGAAQREDVVGRVVEEDTDMTGAVRIEAGAEQRGKALRSRRGARRGSTRGRRSEARADRR